MNNNQDRFDKEETEELNEQQISQQLSGIIKSSRDIMRKDKGLSSDVERLPMLTWIMFLKLLDDVEQHREVEAELEGNPFKPLIDPPYRWRDWASPDNPTGQDLLSFIEHEETILPNGKRGLGLFPYLRSLRGDGKLSQRDIIASIFQDTYNRMTKGYLLKDILLKFDVLDFSSSKHIHVMGRLYETMLREMRDAAGDAGEFYTPRPVIRFMVEAISPNLGEIILDPAVGTGGFLVETFEYLKKSCVKADDIDVLQDKSLKGYEAKTLPYLLCNMNLLLHSINPSNILKRNSLTTPLREIGDKDRVDIILTNPPFGGEEEKSILRNFPKDKQTTETSLLFLQLIMRLLKRPKGTMTGGRCGVILPDGALFGSGVSAKIRKELIEKFNLNTIIRLPQGVFSPYTGIRTNILFFEAKGPTEKIWYYQLPLPEDRKSFSKTKPITIKEFEPILDWWDTRKENEHSWVVSKNDLDHVEFNLDQKNPFNNSTEIEKSPSELLAELLVINEEIQSSLRKIKRNLEME
jgi:type I restriction enzyme M protein